MMFDVPWSQVTDDMINDRAIELKQKTGGWIWHRKWNGEKIIKGLGNLETLISKRNYIN